MSESNMELDRALNLLLDARGRCVYHSRGWWLLDDAVGHLLAAELSLVRSETIRYVRPDLFVLEV